MGQSLKSVVSTALLHAFQSIGANPKSIVVLESKPGTGFHYQTAAALQFAGDSLPMAESVCRSLLEQPFVEAATATGRGFVNLRVRSGMLASIEPVPKLSDGQRVVVDFGGPNIAKPLHVGHLRSFVIGESIRRILVATGHDVVSDIHLGDWGLPMGQVVDALIRMGVDADAVEDRLSPMDLERIYPEAAAACKLDPERLESARATTARLQAGRPIETRIWQAIKRLSMVGVNGAIDRLDVHFDLLLGESDCEDVVAGMVAELVSSGLAIESQGAVVVPVHLPADGERPLPPLMLVKSNGSSSYETTDLATVLQRHEQLGAERIVYVVDERQADHFEQIARAAAMWGRISDVEIVHAGFGTVDGPDGRPLKTRDGGAVRLDALIDDAVAAARSRASASDETTAEIVGVGAIKFLDLSTVRGSGYVFDLERALSFEGDTGPYVQYAAVRMTSLVGKSSATGGDPAACTSGPSAALLLECARLQDAIAAAAAELQPSRIAMQCLRIAKAFNRFYAEEDILGSDREADLIALVAMALERLSIGLGLLAIDVPNRM